jgi:exodeoxyribonuclease III
MKITSWNVNGIRAAMNKGLVEWVANHQPDVLCLQEVKARPEQVPGADQILPGGAIAWHPARQPGYSGVATFSKYSPVKTEIGLGEARFNEEGRVIQTQFPDFLLFNIYFPNGQRGQGRLGYKLDFYARLLEVCDSLHQQGQKIVITGDFNTAHREIDLAHPRQNVMNSGFLPEEREWIDRFLAHGFKDIYRQLYPERVQYTWWTYISGARSRNVGWRLDYFLVSDALVGNVADVIIHDDIPGSDHCPVTMILV